MDKSKNKDDLRQAGRKRLEEFRQRKLQKGNLANNLAQPSKHSSEGEETSLVSIGQASEKADVSTESFAPSTSPSKIFQEVDREYPAQPASNTEISEHSSKCEVGAIMEPDKHILNPDSCTESRPEVHTDMEEPCGFVTISSLESGKISSVSENLDTNDTVAVADLSEDDMIHRAAYHKTLLSTGSKITEKMDADEQGMRFLKDESEEGSLSGLIVPNASDFCEKEVSSGPTVEECAAPYTLASNVLLPIDWQVDICAHGKNEAMVQNLQDLAKNNHTALDFMRNSESNKKISTQLQDFKISKSDSATSKVGIHVADEDVDQVGTSFRDDKQPDLSAQQVQGAQRMLSDSFQQDLSLKEENAKLICEVQQMSKQVHALQVDKEQVIKELEEMTQKYLITTRDNEELCQNMVLLQNSTNDLANWNSELGLNYQKLNAELEACNQKQSQCSLELNLAKKQLQEASLLNDKFALSLEEWRQESEKMATEKEDLTSSLMHAEMQMLEIEKEKSELLTMLNEKEQFWTGSLIKQAELEESLCKEAAEVSALKESFKNLQELLVDKESAILQLKEQLHNVDDEKTKLCIDLESSRLEAKGLRHENAGLKASLHNLEESDGMKHALVSELEERLRKMEGQNCVLETDIEEKKIELQSIEGEKLALERAIGQYKSKFASLGDEKEKLLAYIQSIKEAKHSLFLVLEESKHQFSDSTKDVSKLVKVVMNTREQLMIVTEEKRSHVSEIEKLYQKMEAQEVRHAKEVEVSCALARQLETEKQMLCRQAEATVNENHLVQGQVEDLRHRLQEELDNRRELSLALETSEQQIRRLSSEILELRDQVNDGSNDNELRMSQVEVLHKQMEEEKLQNSSYMESLSIQLQELTTEKQILLSSCECLKFKLKDLTQETTNLQNEVEKLRQELHESFNEKAIMLSTLEASREQVVKVERELSETRDCLSVIEKENVFLKLQRESLQKQIEAEEVLPSSEIKSQNLEAGNEGPSESSEMSSKLLGLGNELEKLGREKELLLSQLDTLQLQLEKVRVSQSCDFEGHTLVLNMEAEKEPLLNNIKASSLQEKCIGEESVYLQAQINDLMQKLQDMSDDRDHLLASLEDSKVQLLNLEDEKSTVITSLTSSEQLLQDSNKQIIFLSANCESRHQELLKLNDVLKHARVELDQHKQLVKQKEMETKQLEEELKLSLLDLKELAGHKEGLLLKLDEADGHLSFLRSDRDSALHRCEELTAQLLLEEDVKTRLHCEVTQLQSQVQALKEERDTLHSEMTLREKELQVQRKEFLHLEEQLHSVNEVLTQQSAETELTKAQLGADLESSKESLQELASKSASEIADLLAQIKELKMGVSEHNTRDAVQLSLWRAHLYSYAGSNDFTTTDIGHVDASGKYDAKSQVASGVAKLVKAFEEKASSSCIDIQVSDLEHTPHVHGSAAPPLETNAGKVVTGGLMSKPDHMLREDLELAVQRLHDVDKERTELALALSRLEVFAAAQLQLNKELTDKVALLTMEHDRYVEGSGHQTRPQISSQNSHEGMSAVCLEQAAVLEFTNDKSTHGLDLSDMFVVQANVSEGELGVSVIPSVSTADSAACPEGTMSTITSEFSERQETLARLYDNLVIQRGTFLDDKILADQSSDTVSLLDHRDWKKVIDMANFTCYVVKVLLEHIEYLQTTYAQCINIKQSADENAILEVKFKQLQSMEALDSQEKSTLLRSLQELSEKCSIFLVEFFQHSDCMGVTSGGNVIPEGFGKLFDKFTVIKNQMCTSKDSKLLSDLTGLQQQTAELVSFLDELGQHKAQLRLVLEGQAESTMLQQYREDPTVKVSEGEPQNSSIKIWQDLSCSKVESRSIDDETLSINAQDVGQSHQSMDMEKIMQLLNGIHENIKRDKTAVQHDDLIDEFSKVTLPAVRDKYNAIVIDVNKLIEKLVSFNSFASMKETLLTQNMPDQSVSEILKLDIPGKRLDSQPIAAIAMEACDLEHLSKQLRGLRDEVDVANEAKAKLEAEFEQVEQKLFSTKEKLSLAISKGKALVQQRDAVKHALTTKLEEFDLLEAEVHAKDARFQEMEVKLRESEIAVKDAKLLQEELSMAKQNLDAVKGSFEEANAVQQTLEAALGRIVWPLELTDKDLCCKVDWLLNSYKKSEDSLAVAVHNLCASENATDIITAELRVFQEKVKVLTDSLAKQQRENEELLNKLHNLSEELSSATRNSDQEKALLKTDLDSLKKQFDEQASALANEKGSHAVLSSALDDLLDNLQKFHSENFGEKIESSHSSDPVSRLEACIHTLLDKHKLSTEEFDELTQRTAAMVAETDQQRKEREENEQKHKKLMETLAMKDLELSEFSRKMEEAAMTMAYQEDEIQGYQHRLQRMKEELQLALDERDRLQSELSEDKQKLVSFKEKLGLAVKKGKGLAQQRDALKQSLLEKTGELDLIVAAHNEQLQEKDGLLDENRHKIHALEEELVFSKGVLASIEQALNSFHKAEILQATNLADKVQWVVHELDKAWFELPLANKNHSLAIERFQEALDQAQVHMQSLDMENKVLKDAVNAKGRELENLQQSLIEACEKQDFLTVELSQSTNASSKYSDEKQMLQAAVSEAWLQVGEAKEKVETLKVEADASLESKVKAENILLLVQEELLVTREKLQIACQGLELKTTELSNVQAVLSSLLKKFTNIFDQAESVLTINVDSIRYIHHVLQDIAAQGKSQNVDESGFISLNDYAGLLVHFQEKMKFSGPTVLANSASFSILSFQGRQKSSSQSEDEQVEDKFILWRRRLEELHISFRQELNGLHQNLDKAIENIRQNLEAVGHHKEAEVVKLQDDIFDLKSHIASKERSILSILAEREDLECTVSNFKQTILEKEEQFKKLMDSLASAENIIEDLGRKVAKLEAKNQSLETIAAKWEAKVKLAHQSLQLADEREAHLRSAKEELAFLQTVLSSKGQELERQSLIIQDAEKHIGVLNVQVKDLEDSNEQKQIAMLNLEASRSKAATKLTTTLNKFSELWKQCESLLAEIEKLQHNLENREHELSQLRQENANADSEIQKLRNDLERNNSEMSQLNSELSELLVVLGAAENGLFPSAATREVLDVVPSVSAMARMKEIVKYVGGFKEEVKVWRIHADKKDAIVLDLRKNLEVVQAENAVLQSTLNSTQKQLETFQHQYVAHPLSNATIVEEVPPVEIEEMGQRGKATLLHPSSSHIRGIRKPSYVAVDVDTEDDLPQLDIDSKGHTFRPLMTSKFIPKVTRVLAERLDGLFYGGGKLLMRQPLARLGISIYCVAIHLWILSILSAAIY